MSFRPFPTRPATRAAALAVAAVGVVAATQAVHAVTATDEAASYTGCLRTAGSNAGKLFAVKRGLDPTRPCTEEEQSLRLSGGDLTSFHAGTGLVDTSPEKYLGITGRGAVDVQLAPTYRLPQTCAANSVATWSGTTWTCPAPPAPGPQPRVLDLGTEAGESFHVVGNDWSTVGSMQVPAGSWKLSSRVHAFDNVDDTQTFLDCRLDVTGATFRDRLFWASDEGYEYGLLDLSAYHTSNVAFTVATVCRDSRTGRSENESGVFWQSLHMTADPTRQAVRVQ